MYRPAVRSRRSVLALIALLYAVGLVAWNLARFTPVANWWPFAVVDIFEIWLYLPLPLLLIAALARRDGRAAAWLAAPLLLFGWQYGGLFLPRPVPDGGVTFQVMTANLLQYNDDDASFVAAVVEQDPDLVVVQELRGQMADRLSAALGGRYSHRALQPGDAASGMGIFSRYPIRSSSRAEMRDGGCFCQQVVVEIGDTPIIVLNVHPPAPSISYTWVEDIPRIGGFPLPTSFRADGPAEAVGRIVERAETIHEPLVVLGDFNTADRQPAYRLIGSRLSDTYREVGWGLGYTWPNRRIIGPLAVPLVRIDYVFHDDAWTARAARTGTLRGSDHRYVVADLLLR